MLGDITTKMNGSAIHRTTKRISNVSKKLKNKKFIIK